MPVKIEELEVIPRPPAPDQPPPPAPAGAKTEIDGEVARTIALLRSRELRLRAS